MIQPSDQEIKNIKQLKVDFCQTFQTEAGIRVLTQLEKWGFKRDSTFVPGDVYGTIINEGRRQMLISIENVMTLNVDKLTEMRKELL